jgi:hypothetical protein
MVYTQIDQISIAIVFTRSFYMGLTREY